MSAAILCLAACIINIRSKAGMYGNSMNMPWAKHFLLLTGKEWSNMTAPWGAQLWSKKVALIYRYWQNMQPNETCRWTYLNIFYISKPACILPSVPFKWRKPDSYLLHSWSPRRQEHIEDVTGSETSSAADQNMLFCKLLIPLWCGIIIKTPWSPMLNCVLDIWTSLLWQWPCYLALVQVKVNVDVQGNNQDISLTWAARQKRVLGVKRCCIFSQNINTKTMTHPSYSWNSALATSNTSHWIQNFNYLFQFHLWNSPWVSVQPPSTLYSSKTMTIIRHTNLGPPSCKHKHLVKDDFLTLVHLFGTICLK